MANEWIFLYHQSINETLIYGNMHREGKENDLGQSLGFRKWGINFNSNLSTTQDLVCSY